MSTTVVAAIAALVLALAASADAGAASPLGTFPACAPGTSALEAQGWDVGADDRVTPNDEHVHTGVCFPMLGILSRPVDVDVRTLLHNSDATLTFVRWQDGSRTQQTIKTDWTPGIVREAKRVDVLRLDPAGFAHSGWQEVRISSNVVDPKNGRWYTTARYCVFVANGKGRSDYCGGPGQEGRCGAADNYLGAYHNVRIDCRSWPRAPVSGRWCPKVRGESADVVVLVDPDIHAGDLGTEVLRAGGGHDYVDACVDTTRLADGPHVLLVRTELSKRGVNMAGVFRIPFTVRN